MKQKTVIVSFGNYFVAMIFILFTGGCTSLAVNPILDPLALSLQKQTDLDLLEEGAPSLLLILDGLIASDPGNKRLLMAGIKAYGAYATILQGEGRMERAANISAKAKEYGIALLAQLPRLENINDRPLTGLDLSLEKISSGNAGYLFWGAYGWGLWIQLQSGAPAAMAKLPMVEQIMLRVIELDESYYYGGAHIFLGSYYGSLPATLGGKLEESRFHFERALALNDRKFLLTQVIYAETYARTAFDRELFAELLKEVIEQPLADSEMASSNKMAKAKAEKLFTLIDDFF